MERPKPPARWSEFRAWLLELSDGERRHVRGWLRKFIARDGSLTPEAMSAEHSRKMDPFRNRR